MAHPALYRQHCQELVGFIVWHDDSIAVPKEKRSGSTLEHCFRETGKLYNRIFGESYHILECEYRGHDRPQGWRYEGSVEQRLASDTLRPSSVMIGSRAAPDPN